MLPPPVRVRFDLIWFAKQSSVAALSPYCHHCRAHRLPSQPLISVQFCMSTEAAEEMVEIGLSLSLIVIQIKRL